MESRGCAARQVAAFNRDRGIHLKSIYRQRVNGNGSADMERWLSNQQSSLYANRVGVGDGNSRERRETGSTLDFARRGSSLLSLDEFPNDNFIPEKFEHRRNYVRDTRSRKADDIDLAAIYFPRQTRRDANHRSPSHSKSSG